MCGCDFLRIAFLPPSVTSIRASGCMTAVLLSRISLSMALQHKLTSSSTPSRLHRFASPVSRAPTVLILRPPEAIPKSIFEREAEIEGENNKTCLSYVRQFFFVCVLLQAHGGHRSSLPACELVHDLGWFVSSRSREGLDRMNGSVFKLRIACFGSF